MKKLLAVLLVLIPCAAGAFFFTPGGSSGSGTTSASDLSSGTLPAARIGDNSVTNAKLQDNTVNSNKIKLTSTNGGYNLFLDVTNRLEFNHYDNTGTRVIQIGFYDDGELWLQSEPSGPSISIGAGGTDNVVITGQLQSDNVLITGGSIDNVTVSLADNSVTAKKLKATSGTPSATTYFRGDNTWQTPAGTGTVTEVTGNAMIGVATGTTTPALSITDNSITVEKLKAASGTPSGTTFFRGDNTWATPTGTGDFSGPASSTDNALVIFNGTGGKTGKNSPCTVGVDNVLTCPGGFVTSQSATVPGYSRWYELSGNGTDYASVRAPDNLAETYAYVLPPAKCTSGQSLRFTSDNVTLECYTPSTTSGVGSGAMPHTYQGLYAKAMDNTQAYYVATSVVFNDGSILALDNTVVNITASGENGLDNTESEVSSTWYHAFVIAKVDNTVALMLSTSTTAPSLPSGYTRFSRIGAIYNNASSNFAPFYQVDREVATSAVAVVTAETNMAWRSVNISTAVPVTAKSVRGTGTVYGSLDVQILVAIAPVAAGAQGISIFQITMASSYYINTYVGYFQSVVFTPQTLYSAGEGDNYTVEITGYIL